MSLVHSPFHRNQRGTALVELALILPLLVVMFVGVVDFGLFIREHQILQNAAREGARYSALPANYMLMSSNPSAIESSIKNRVVTYLQQENITVATSNVTVNQLYPVDIGGGSGLTATASEVVVSYSRSPLVGGSLFGPVVLTARSVFRNCY